MALAAARSLERLAAQARAWRPEAVALEHPGDEAAARAALAAASPGSRVFTGPGAAARMAAECDAGTVLNGIWWAAGLSASLAALGARRRAWRWRTRRRWWWEARWCARRWRAAASWSRWTASTARRCSAWAPARRRRCCV